MKITVETKVAAPLEQVWRAWTTPDDIKQWNAATDDWHTPRATVDLRVDGAFSSRMEAKDGSMGFDFAGTFTRVVRGELIEYSLGDSRKVLVEFSAAKMASQYVKHSMQSPRIPQSNSVRAGKLF